MKPDNALEVPVCFWCFKISVEVGQVGRPLVPVIKGYNPCPECSEIMHAGVSFIEVDPDPMFESQEPIEHGGAKVYPTSNWWVLNDSQTEEVKKVLNLHSETQERKYLIATKVAEGLGFPKS